MKIPNTILSSGLRSTARFAAILCIFVASVNAEPREKLLYTEPQMWSSLYEPAYKSPTELESGSELRKSLFNQLRPKISNIVGGRKVLFEGSLKAYRNWAFFSGRTVDSNGTSVALMENGNSDTFGLWLRTLDGWVLVDFIPGATVEFAWGHWTEQFGAPHRLLTDGLP